MPIFEKQVVRYERWFGRALSISHYWVVERKTENRQVQVTEVGKRPALPSLAC